MILIETNACVDELNDMLVRLGADVENPSITDMEEAIDRAGHMLASSSEYACEPSRAWQLCNMARAEEMQIADELVARWGGIGFDTTLAQHIMRIAYALVYHYVVSTIRGVLAAEASSATENA